MRIKLIANPISGGDSRPKINATQTLLQKLGAEVDLYLTGARGDARKAAALACSEGYDRIVAAGGDGTLNEVVNGVTSSELPIALLPLGTVNVFALEAGISKQLEKACALAVQGSPRQITLGRINGELFLLMASAGWDAEAVANVNQGLKRRTGRLAYALSALEVLLLRTPPPLELVLPDGRCRSGFGVVISNCRYYGGPYMVSPEASMLRPGLEVCLLRNGSRWARLKFAAALFLRRPLRSPLVEFFSVQEAALRGEGVAVQVDGDDWGRLPFHFEAVPRAVTMVLPVDFK